MRLLYAYVATLWFAQFVENWVYRFTEVLNEPTCSATGEMGNSQHLKNASPWGPALPAAVWVGASVASHAGKSSVHYYSFEKAILYGQF